MSNAAAFEIYCSTLNSAAGDGSIGNPYSALSSLVWTGANSISNAIANGSNVVVYLQRGSEFRETLTVGTSGSGATTVAFADYGNGPKPKITGAIRYTNFVQYSGSVYSNAAAGTVVYVVMDGDILTQGTHRDGLEDRQWVRTNSIIYVRDTRSNPTNRVVEGTLRTRAVDCFTRTNIYFTNIVMELGNNDSIRVVGANILLEGCELRNSQYLIVFTSSSCTNFVARSCIFEKAFANQMLDIQGNSTRCDFYYCRFGPSPLTTYLVNITSGGIGGDVNNFVNCTFVGNRLYSILLGGGAQGKVNVANCMTVANAAGNSAGLDSFRATSGTMTLSNCLIMASGKDPTKSISGISVSNALVYAEPQFKSRRFPGVIVISCDDGRNFPDWLDLAAMATNYGYGINFAYSLYSANTWTVEPEITNQLRQAVLDGHEIASHSTYHSYLSEDRAFRTTYSGGAATATIAVANSNLTVQLDGTNYQVLDLTNVTHDTILDVYSHLNGLPDFSCLTFVGVGNDGALSRWLTNMAPSDIKGVSVTNYLHSTNRMYEEVVLSKAILESIITNYTVNTFVYPGGGQNATVIQSIKDAGYIAGRGVNTPPADSYRIGSNYVWLASVSPNIHGPVFSLPLENSATDASAGASSWNASGITFQQTNVFRGSYSATFNGTSDHLFRVDSAVYDCSFGDWMWAGRVWPASMTNPMTLFFQGQNATNYVRVSIQTNGALRLDAMTNGGTVIDISSAAGSLTNLGWQSIEVSEYQNVWKLRVNETNVTTAIAFGRLADFGGVLLMGVGTNHVGAVRTNYFRGILDDLCMSAKGYWLTTSMLETMQEEGSIVHIFNHGLSQCTLAMWRVMLDAIYDNGTIQVMTFSDARNYVVTNGFAYDFTTDVYGRFLITSNDYNIKATSAARLAGNTSPLFGVTNLFDLNGRRMTDGNGKPLRSFSAIGSQEFHTARWYTGFW